MQFIRMSGRCLRTHAFFWRIFVTRNSVSRNLSYTACLSYSAFDEQKRQQMRASLQAGFQINQNILIWKISRRVIFSFIFANWEGVYADLNSTSYLPNILWVSAISSNQIRAGAISSQSPLQIRPICAQTCAA